MPRTWVAAANEGATLGIGALGQVIGPLTIAAVVKMATDQAGVTRVIVFAGVDTVGTARWWFGVGGPGTNGLTGRIGGTSDTAPSLSLLVSEGWALIGIRKATGSAIPVYFKYVYSTGIYTEENGGGAIANATAPLTSAFIGRDNGLASVFNGQIEVVGAFAAVLTIPQILGLRFRIKPWLDLAPKGLWALDQPTTTQRIDDWSGGGAHQTALSGTSVFAGATPNWNFGFASGPQDVLGTLVT